MGAEDNDFVFSRIALDGRNHGWLDKVMGVCFYGDITSSSNRVRIGADAVMVGIAAAIGQGVKDVGPVEGRTISGLLATPLASPTTKTA